MVIIFDLDGVIIGSTFFSDILMKILCEKLEDHNYRIERPVIFQEILKRFIKKLGGENKSLAYDWDLLIQEYLSEYNIAWTCEIEEIFGSDELLNYTYLYNDVLDVLEWLSENGYTMAVLTNGLPKYQDHVIEKLGLQRFFDRIIMPNSISIKMVKPYLEIFKLAMEGFQGTHYMIGDSLYFDISGANKAGCKTVWLLRKLPKKYKALSIKARTEKINQNPNFLLKYILRSAPFLELSVDSDELKDFRPDYIIYTLQELKELFLKKK